MSKNTIDNNLPAQHHTINGFIVAKGAVEFIDFLEYVFDGEENKAMRIPDRDGSLIHAEVMIGDSTILTADRKDDWAFTPALTQVYVKDAEVTLKKAVERGGKIVTPISKFYGDYDIARFTDPWNNLWWLFAPAKKEVEVKEVNGTTDWHDAKPSQVYVTLMETMRNLKEPKA